MDIIVRKAELKNGRVIQLFIVRLFGLLTCLFVNNIATTKQIDQYRSSKIQHHQNSNSIISSGGNGGGHISSSSHCSKEEGMPWLIEIKNILRFILEELKIMAK